MRAILALPLALVVSACAAAEQSAAPDAGHGMAVVNVTATYRERILLPPGHVLTVRVEDVSLADAPATVLAEHREPLDGRAPPYQATLGFPRAQIDPRHTYAVRAEIRDGEGRLRFTTDTRHAVLTQGAPASAEIVMVGVR
jgi:putative lipoprotein